MRDPFYPILGECYLLPGAAHDAAHAPLLTVLDVNLLYLHLGLRPALTRLTLSSSGKHL